MTVDLPDAVRAGRREGLESLRDVLAESILHADHDKRAPLARQLTIVLEQLDLLPESKGASPIDDLASKRSARRAGAAGI